MSTTISARIKYDKSAKGSVAILSNVLNDLPALRCRAMHQASTSIPDRRLSNCRRSHDSETKKRPGKLALTEINWIAKASDNA